MSRWKYQTAQVSIGEDSVTVRGLTAGEQLKLREAKRKALADDAAGKITTGQEATNQIVMFGVIDPPLTEADLDDMPVALMLHAAAKIMELSGVKSDDPDEKKDEAAAS